MFVGKIKSSWWVCFLLVFIFRSSHWGNNLEITQAGPGFYVALKSERVKTTMSSWTSSLMFVLQNPEWVGRLATTGRLLMRKAQTASVCNNALDRSRERLQWLMETLPVRTGTEDNKGLIHNKLTTDGAEISRSPASFHRCRGPEDCPPAAGWR